MSKLVSIGQAAKIAGVTVETLREWERQEASRKSQRASAQVQSVGA